MAYVALTPTPRAAETWRAAPRERTRLGKISVHPLSRTTNISTRDRWDVENGVKSLIDLHKWLTVEQSYKSNWKTEFWFLGNGNDNDYI